MEKAVVAAWLEGFDHAAALVTPHAPVEHRGGRPRERNAAEHPREEGRRVGDAGQTDGDVVEQDGRHPAQTFQARVSKLSGSGMNRLRRGPCTSRVMWP